MCPPYARAHVTKEVLIDKIWCNSKLFSYMEVHITFLFIVAYLTKEVYMLGLMSLFNRSLRKLYLNLWHVITSVNVFSKLLGSF